MSKVLDILLAGHVTHDVLGDHHVLGGAVSYGSILASKLGHKTSVLTSYSGDFAYQETLASHHIVIEQIKSIETTVFDNKRRDTDEVQLLISRADDIVVRAEYANKFDLIIFGPLTDEIIVPEINLIASTKAGIIQGWLRACHTPGPITFKQPDISILEGLDIIICSQVELAQLSDQIRSFLLNEKHTVITDGKSGASVYYNGKEFSLPALTTKALDTTGAGDIFGTTYCISFMEDKDILSSLAKANVAAGLSIQGIGINAIPDKATIEELFQLYKKDYL